MWVFTKLKKNKSLLVQTLEKPHECILLDFCKQQGQLSKDGVE